MSVANLSLFNSSENPYRKYQSLDNLAGHPSKSDSDTRPPPAPPRPLQSAPHTVAEGYNMPLMGSQVQNSHPCPSLRSFLGDGLCAPTRRCDLLLMHVSRVQGDGERCVMRRLRVVVVRSDPFVSCSPHMCGGFGLRSRALKREPSAWDRTTSTTDATILSSYASYQRCFSCSGLLRLNRSYPPTLIRFYYRH